MCVCRDTKMREATDLRAALRLKCAACSIKHLRLEVEVTEVSMLTR